MKKQLLLFLTMLMAVVMPMKLWAADGNPEPYAVLSDNNTKLTFFYDDQKDARGGMGVGPFEDLGSSGVSTEWYGNKSTITTVVFDDSFANCTTLTSTAYWFYQLSKLTTITGIQNLKMDNVNDINSMFCDCESLTSLNLSSLNLGNVTNMHQMFEGCTGLENISFAGVNTENVTNMGDLFLNCRSLKTIDLSSFNTSKVTNMAYMFYRCTSLTTVYVSDSWTTANVTNSERMFERCTNIVGGMGTTFDENVIDASYAHIDGGTSNPGYFTANNERVINGNFVTTDYSSFAIGYNYQIQELTPSNIVEDSDDPNNLCVKVVSLDDSDPNQMGESEFLIRIGEPLQLGQKYTFSMRAKANRNAAIQSLALKDNYEYLHWKMVGDYNLTTEWKTYTYEAEVVAEQVGCLTIAFCLDLESQSTEYFFDDISFRVNEAPSASPEPYAVLSDNNTKLTFFYDDQKDVRGGMSVGPFYMNDAGYIEGRQWNDAVGSITTVVFDNSFVNCTSLTSTYGWFYGCKNLITITDISNLKTDNVADMSYMFSDCSSLKTLNVSGFKTDNVVNIWFMFSGCSSLTSLDVSGFNMGNVWEMFGMFSGCSKLTSLDLGDFNTENVRYMTGLFGECSSLTSLDVSGFNTTNVIDMNSMFRNCSSLTSLDLSNFNTSNVTDMSFMFWRCNNLLSLDISNFNTANAEMDRIFEECSSLASIKAGNANILTEEYAKIGNPNLLVYVNEARLAPSNVQNVVINGLAREIVLTDAQDGNNDWYAPQAFVAERISYTRNFAQSTSKGTSRGWESIALPFDVQTIQHESKGVIAPFNNSASNKHFWLRRLTDNGLQAATNIEANTPYIISMPNSEEYVADYNLNGRVTFAAQNVDVPATTTKVLALADSSIVMVPAMQRQSRSSSVWALNVGEVRGQYFEGSVFERDYRTVRPFEAYTIHRQENGQPAPRYVPIQEIAGATGIDATLMNSEEVNSEEWYDMQGRKLEGKPARKGVYISNGKKVVVK